jgi:hypothetical protein
VCWWREGGAARLIVLRPALVYLGLCMWEQDGGVVVCMCSVLNVCVMCGYVCIYVRICMLSVSVYLYEVCLIGHCI